MESAITSRLISEHFIPSAPILMPSEMETVLNSIGVPPAARMPSFTWAARLRRCKLHGPISIQVLATPTIGRDRSSSVKPAALNIARDWIAPQPGFPFLPYWVLSAFAFVPIGPLARQAAQV